jgi:hypothetical protein
MTTTIGVVTFVFVLALGAFTLVREAGYEFDLRNRRNRRILGGRRVTDRA